MASEVTIPRLGWNMDEGIFVGWLKSDGELVAAGEPLFSLEGDKATQEIESLEAGILRIPPDGPKDGEKVAVGTVIGYLVAPGEPAPFEAIRSNAAVDHVTVSREGEAASEPEIAVASTQPAIHRQRLIRLGRSLALPLEASHLSACPARRPRAGHRCGRTAGSGKSGRIVERDIRAAARTIEPARLRARPVPAPRTPARSSSLPSAERSPSAWSRAHRPPRP